MNKQKAQLAIERLKTLVSTEERNMLDDIERHRGLDHATLYADDLARRLMPIFDRGTATLLDILRLLDRSRPVNIAKGDLLSIRADLCRDAHEQA